MMNELTDKLDLTKNMRIGARMGTGFGLIIVFLAVVAIFTTMRLGTLQEVIDEVVEVRFPKTEEANEVIDEINLIARNLPLIYILDEGERDGELAHIDTAHRTIEERFAAFEADTSSREGQEVLSRARNNYHEYYQMVNTYLNLATDEELSGAQNMLLNTIRPAQNELIAAVAAMVEHETREMTSGGNFAQEMVFGGRSLVLSLSVGAILLGILAAFIITRSISRPLTRIGQGLHDAAMNEMDTVVQRSAANAEESAAAAEELSAMAHQMTDFVAELMTLVEGKKARDRQAAVQHQLTVERRKQENNQDPKELLS
ncbi:MCP four helix bundle domain-containing protein [Desulfurivibrio dismutans]|uniref:MCP four helix bundle domain-containing protein n=1 Tax=Desulfurivibrio dismutans TaxID=1398908 RepID=UPI0023DA0B4E|nr:MCP four helix bundle domain-containing protein [Desulfurivibrio alkaliphilus]MDF1615522.1 MCP four helix bundle domain-containing protein [Desulfurivibrio alkaliphilus]